MYFSCRNNVFDIIVELLNSALLVNNSGDRNHTFLQVFQLWLQIGNVRHYRGNRPVADGKRPTPSPASRRLPRRRGPLWRLVADGKRCIVSAKLPFPICNEAPGGDVAVDSVLDVSHLQPSVSPR